MFPSHVFPWFAHGFLEVMGLSGGTNTFELSGDVRDPTAVVLARIRKAQFAAGLDGKTGENRGENRGNPLRNDGWYMEDMKDMEKMEEDYMNDVDRWWMEIG